MRLGGLFGKLRSALSTTKKEVETKPAKEYVYRVSGDDNIRFHVAESSGSKILDALKQTFPNLEEVTFTNLRLRHENATDARATVAEIVKRNPHFLIIESAYAPERSQDVLNDYVQGRRDDVDELRAGEFLGTLMRLLRDLKSGGLPVPLLVLSDVPDKTSLQGGLMLVDRIPEILKGDGRGFAETKKQALSRIVEYSKVVLGRDQYIINNLVPQIEKAVKLDNSRAATLSVESVERLDLLAPYGASHGTLSNFARELGVKTAAINQSHSLHPIESMLARVKLSVFANENLSTKDIDDAVSEGILAALIESGIPAWKRDLTEYFGDCTAREYENALRKVVRKWRIEARENKGASLETLYAEAHKNEHDFFERRALPLMRGFLGLEAKGE